MADPTRDADGNVYPMWKCPDCRTFIHLHSDPDHPSHDWTRNAVAEHEYVHREHLAVLHAGDRGSLRLALRYPGLHSAIIQVHGPIPDLHPEHRAQILRSAGIEEGE